jgi:hypothetical protein
MRAFARKMLVRMVVLHELPLSIVEYDGFQKFVASLNPSFHMIRKALKNDILKAFDEHKKSLKELFGASKSRISLTMDLWTSNQTIGYMVITAHFINDKWKLEKRIIKFNTLETPHTGLSMFHMVLKCIRELNFEDKVFALTLDNASNNGRMAHMLRENLVSKKMLVVTQYTTACWSMQVVDITLVKYHFTNITSLRVVQEKHSGLYSST